MAGNFQRALQKTEQIIKSLDEEMRKAYEVGTEESKALASRLGDNKTLATQLRAELRSSAPSGRIV